jgi:class 3 adenylate cyclase
MPSAKAHPAPPADRETAIRTFLIADVRGYTRFTRERGDEAAARIAARFAQIAVEGVEAFQGDLIETRGDEVLAVFGSPRRALRAGVELQDAFAHEAALDPSLPLRVGIGLAAGEAVRVGDGFRGNALNMAARLCARADAGVVLATEELVGLAGPIDGIAYEPAPPLDLKGVEGAVRPVRISSRAAAEPAKREEPPAGPVPDLPPELDAVSPILGREHELRVLRWFWRRARHGHGRAVFVHGPSGAGKTRLAAELARVARAERALVLYAACAGPAERALTQLADAATSRRPTLVVADDLDSAGGTVLDTVGTLLESLATRPLLVLGTYRSDASPLVSTLVDRVDPSRERRLALGKLEPEGTGPTSSPPRAPIAAGWRKLAIALAAAGALALAVATPFLVSTTSSDDNPSPRSASDINAEILGPVLASDRALTNRILSLTGTRPSLRRNRPRIRAGAAALFAAVKKAQSAAASAPLPPGSERSRQLFQLALSDHLVHAKSTQRAAQDLPTYYDVWAVVYTADEVARSYEALRRAAPTLRHPVQTARAAKRLLDVSAPFPVRPEQGVLWRPDGYRLDPVYARRYARRVNAFGLRRLRSEILSAVVDFQNESIPYDEASRRIGQLVARLNLIKLEVALTPEPRLTVGTKPGPAVLPSPALRRFVNASLTQALAAQSWMIATHSGDPEAGAYHSAYLEAGSRASTLENAFFRDFEQLQPTE